MAPPKRKTGGGRTTPAGTKPGERVDRSTTTTSAASATSARSATSAGSAKSPRPAAGGVGASSRYTPPVPQRAKESPPWLPVLMLALFALGAIAIMLRYLVFPDSNIPLLVGLLCLLAGLFTATKWR